MALPSSGAIAFSDINTELGVSSTTQRSLNDCAVRTLFGQSSGAVDMNTGHGKSNGGSVSYTSPGSYSWTVPAGVTSISVLAIGGGDGGGRGCGRGAPSGGKGGGLAWRNNVTVTPGTTYTVIVGRGGYGAINFGCGYYSYVRAKDCGVSSSLCPPSGATILTSGGSYATGYGSKPSGRVTGAGGVAGFGNGANFYCSYAHASFNYNGFGACVNSGANCHNCPHPLATQPGGCGGGGGGGAYRHCGGSYLYFSGGGGGGGIGLFGKGSNGSAGNWVVYGTTGCHPGTGGGGGSGGSAGSDGSSYCIGGNPVVTGGNGGNYGGGGGAAVTGGYYISPYSKGGGGNGAGGAIRIVWPGSSRQFPSTCVGSP